MARTTYRVQADTGPFQTTDARTADDYSRRGIRVTAVTHA